MKQRLPFQSFGSPAFTPDGVPWAMYPDDMWGSLTRCVQFALRALLSLWDGLDTTDVTRKQLRDMINELREKRGLPPIMTLRSVTWYLAELVRLGIIERKRQDGTNTWYTRLTKPFMSRLNDKPDGAAAAAQPSTTFALPEPADSSPAEKQAAAARAIQAVKSKGWAIMPSEPEGIKLVAIEGVEPEDLDAGMRWYLDRIAPAIRALLQPEPHARE
jgi:hypothetical protein